MSLLSWLALGSVEWRALFQEQREFIDVRLKGGEDIFPAHRIAIAANSDYFHAMFAHGMKK